MDGTCLSPPAMRSNDERLHKYQVCTKAMMVMAATVPRAAPATPRLAPGMVMCTPATAKWCVGNIKRKLKRTSSIHIATPIMLGTCILPLQRSMPPATKFNCNMGRDKEKMPK